MSVSTPADISVNDLRGIGLFLAKSISLISAGAGTSISSAQFGRSSLTHHMLDQLFSNLPEARRV